MSAKTPAANSRFDTSSTDEIEQTIAEFTEATVALARDCNASDELCENFEEAARGLTSVVKEIASQSIQADSQASENSDKIQSNSDKIEELQEHSAKSRAELSSRVSEVEQELDDMDGSQGRGSDSSEENPHTPDEETTALEQVCALPEQTVRDNLTKNQSRARSIALRIGEYGKKVPAGIAIPSSRIRRVLTAQEDSTIHRQTVARVADFLKQFGDGDVKIKKTRSGEKTVVFTEELAEAVTSVVTPNEGSPVTQVVV